MDREILGKRTISVGDDGSIEIVVYLPHREENGDFFCEFSLDGLSWSGKKRRVYGIDALQAIYLALQSIGSDLKEMQQAGSYSLTWIGGSHVGDFGLPTIDAEGEGDGKRPGSAAVIGRDGGERE